MQVAGRQVEDSAGSFLLGQRAVDDLEAVACGVERGGHVLGVLQSCAENDARLGVAVPGVVADRVAGDGRLVHALGHLGAVEVARHGAHACHVHGLRGVVDRAAEEALTDEVGDLGATDQVVEHLPESLAVEALRSRGHAEHPGFGPLLDDARPCSCGGVVGFVDDDQVRRQDAVEPAHESLDAGDLRQLMAVGREPCGDESVRHVHGSKRAVALLQELGAVDEDERAVALGGGAGRHVGEHDGFAGACRGDQQGTLAASPEGFADLVNGGLLVWTKGEHVREGVRIGSV